MLIVDVARRIGSLEVEAAFELRERGTLVLVGESGAGKTTLLRLVAGLSTPDRGRVALDRRPLFDSVAGIDVPPERRPVGWVPQHFALFPHLTVQENVAFGLRATRVEPRERVQRTRDILERFGLAALAARRPAGLSGGEQQRVALARALALEPRLLLLDEPLASLDVQTRRRVREELRGYLRSLPCMTLLVTHSPADAVALGERIAVIEAGRLVQTGSPAELVRAPRSDYVAEFLGTARPA